MSEQEDDYCLECWVLSNCLFLIKKPRRCPRCEGEALPKIDKRRKAAFKGQKALKEKGGTRKIQEINHTRIERMKKNGTR